MLTCDRCPSDSQKLVDTFKRLGDLGNRFPVLVGSGGNFVDSVLVDTGRLVCHVVYGIVRMPDGTGKSKGHAGFELGTRGPRDRHHVTASIIQLARACPLPCLRVLISFFLPVIILCG